MATGNSSAIIENISISNSVDTNLHVQECGELKHCISTLGTVEIIPNKTEVEFELGHFFKKSNEKQHN